MCVKNREKQEIIFLMEFVAIHIVENKSGFQLIDMLSCSTTSKKILEHEPTPGRLCGGLPRV